ncbi:MAG: sigma-54-dependent Fis family transcriptional regulator [Planctomycetota bacterium]|nr:MAG: sigma-54-dependent Fis family transcriptional regulator [Planctomycetota bacterium]REK30685.1 MAG: sigma-54-dependent Fis family transcriptional regulator [Planctomycetota bacterium]REK33060.1 MAG: sigma-54-dependent Fis family transcriptional regulator [Planctomycetota bacterium]
MTQTPDLRASTVRLGGRVVVYSQNSQSRQQIAQAVGRQGFDVTQAESADSLCDLLAGISPAACILDEPESPGFVEMVANAIEAAGLSTQVVVLPAITAPRGQFVGLNAEVLEPPHTPERIGRALFAAVGRSQLVSENQQLKQQSDVRLWPELIGYSDGIEKVREQLREIAEDDRPVIVQGESGSGTTFIARAIHSIRKGEHAPLMAVRCEVLAASAAEAALFGEGHESRGRLSAASEGTLLLDDVDALALSVQARLAAALKQIESPPQIIATTHAPLHDMARDGSFDDQLYECLTGHTVTVPALRDRPDDIAPMAEHFLADFAAREGRPAKQLAAEAVQRLQAHHWPGNVRELENVIARGCSLTTDPVLTSDIVTTWLETPSEISPDDVGLSLREMERKLIEATFNRFNGNRELTARALKIGLRTLSGKLREYGYPPRGGPGSNRVSRAA